MIPLQLYVKNYFLTNNSSTDINYKQIFFVSRWNIVVWLSEVLALVVQMLDRALNDESLSNENVLGKLTALFSGQKFIQ